MDVDVVVDVSEVEFVMEDRDDESVDEGKTDESVMEVRSVGNSDQISEVVEGMSEEGVVVEVNDHQSVVVSQSPVEVEVDQSLDVEESEDVDQSVDEVQPSEDVSQSEDDDVSKVFDEVDDSVGYEVVQNVLVGSVLVLLGLLVESVEVGVKLKSVLDVISQSLLDEVSQSVVSAEELVSQSLVNVVVLSVENAGKVFDLVRVVLRLERDVRVGLGLVVELKKSQVEGSVQVLRREMVLRVVVRCVVVRRVVCRVVVRRVLE